MNYYKNDIRNVKGDTFSCALVVEDLGQDLDEIYFTCRDSLNDNSEVLFRCGLDDGINLVEYDAQKNIRKYAIRVSPEKTINLQSGTYYYDEEVRINHDIFTIMKGRFIIEQDCTRKDEGEKDPEHYIKVILDEINGEVIGTTVINKTDYLEETKELIKNMINDLGGNLTDENTFRSYVDEIYNVYPKVIGEGTNIILNTIAGKMSLEIIGNEESVEVLIQNKNLLVLPNNTKTDGGLTGTISNNNILTYSGTASRAYSDITNTKTCDLPAGKYVFSIDGATTNNERIVLYTYGETQQNFIIQGGNTSIVNTLNDKKTSYKLGITNLSSGSSYSGTIKMQLEVNSSATTYIEHEEQNITLPLEEGQNVYSYDEQTNIISSSSIKATALMKGGN